MTFAGAVAAPERAQADGSSPPRRREVRWRRWAVPVAVLVSVLLVRAFALESFVIPSGSMQPALEPGDRVVVNKLAGRPPARGEVVVFDGARSFGPLPGLATSPGVLDRVAALVAGRPEAVDYVKRVVGVGGDRVRCCSPDGRLQVNGSAVDEPYLYPGESPSRVAFDVLVPEGRLWVMGDHRSQSADSRARLGRPGGGMVPVRDVVGVVSFRFWPLARMGRLSDPGAAVGAPRPGADRSAVAVQLETRGSL